MALMTAAQARALRLKQEEEFLNEHISQANETLTETPQPPQPTSLDEALEEFGDFYDTPVGSIQDLLYNQKRCPRCNAPLVPTPSISGAPSTDWMECSNNVCNTFVDMYHPMPHQAAVHLDSHRIIGNFGSYGTGKTKTSGKEIETVSYTHLTLPTN